MCVAHFYSTPGCGRSNSGSNPGILPNIVHTVYKKTRDGVLYTVTWEQKEFLKKYYIRSLNYYDALLKHLYIYYIYLLA